MLLEKIRNKNNLPVILFFIILVNYIPLILPNLISKESHGVNIFVMGICFAFQGILLLISFWKNIDFTEEKIKKLKVLGIISFILVVVQIINLIIGDYKLLDFANIICQFINILMFFICLIDIKIKEKYILKFMKAIVIMGTIACIVNMFLYFKEIYQTFFENLKYDSIKSFFANRNQFAFFIYISIIANFFLVLKENKKINKLILVLFFANVLFTMSRTGILLATVFAGLAVVCLDKHDKKTKIIYLTSIIFFVIIIMLILFFFKPEFVERILRIESLRNLSGRTKIWENGLNLWLENPLNILFGAGRFKGNDVLQIKDRTFTQFHNIYLDFLITGGILELGFAIYIFVYVIRKIKKSDIDEKYKKLYNIVFITYFIYAFMESVGRFSIGATDTLCFIFFISIPLLHSNSTKE